jgi:outer membrane receptor protein involved in Fe transport
VVVASGQRLTVNATLEANAVRLSDMTVSAASRAPERITEAPAAITVVPPDLVRAMAPTGQAPLALATVPGVDVVQNGVNDFNVNARGFNSSLTRRVSFSKTAGIRPIASLARRSGARWECRSTITPESRWCAARFGALRRQCVFRRAGADVEDRA